MMNEFGEEITAREVNELSEKIRKLSEEEIDRLWFRCGWVESDRGKNKALSPKRISSMKKEPSFAKTQVRNLLMETPKIELMKNIMSR